MSTADNTAMPPSSGFSTLEEARRLLQQRRAAEAHRLLEELVRVQPENVEMLDLLAGVQVELGQFEEASRTLAAAIALSPQTAARYGNLGFVLTRLGKLDQALSNYDKAIDLSDDFELRYSRAVVLDSFKRWTEAVAGFDEVLAQKPDHVRAFIARGAALEELQRFAEALASYDSAIQIDARCLGAHFNRGNLFLRLEQYEEALASFDRTIAIDPTRPEFHNNRGIALGKLKRLDEALAGFDQAIALAPDFADALTNRGNVLNDLRRHGEALASHDAALAARPGYARAHVNRGIALFDLGRTEDAIASYGRAIETDRSLADGHYGKAIALTHLKRHEEAVVAYKQAFALAPDLPFLFGKLLHEKAMLCDWSDWDRDNARLAELVGVGLKASPPFPLLARLDDPSLHKRAAEIYANEFGRANAIAEFPAHTSHGKIKLGYFSADFHDHATAALMAELFEHHDRERFELFAFSFGPDTGDAVRRRLVAAFDEFIDVRCFSDDATVELARRKAIDIAIDLKGYTGDARAGLFARRVAPVQVNYLGYPGTLGASWYDYLIGDATLISADDCAHYAEKTVTLPNSYQPNDSKREIAAQPISRAEAGLPEEAFVFCCFNNAYKITPDVFDRWMRILRETKGSVLWLLRDSAATESNLRREAQKRGIAPERLVFASRLPMAQHLARHRLADLFLDTLPYNAHTTASDALWAGLPVLTQRGKSFAGRVAASLLNSVGLPELIAETPEAYVTLALALAADRAQLSALKRKLAENRPAAPLFDIAQFTGNIERAYAAMHERALSGHAADHIAV